MTNFSLKIILKDSRNYERRFLVLAFLLFFCSLPSLSHDPSNPKMTNPFTKPAPVQIAPQDSRANFSRTDLLLSQ